MADQQATSCWTTWRDLAVYGPIGLVSLAIEELPKAAEARREQVTNRIAVARVVGKFAVRTAGAYVTRRLDDITAERLANERAADEAALGDQSAGFAPPGTPPDPTTDGHPALGDDGSGTGAADAVSSLSEAAAGEAIDGLRLPSQDPAAEGVDDATADTTTLEVRSAPVPPVESLALADYDSLAASQIVARLEALPADELEAIRAYESAHRQRRTVTGKISQLQNAPA